MDLTKKSETIEDAEIAASNAGYESTGPAELTVCMCFAAGGIRAGYRVRNPVVAAIARQVTRKVEATATGLPSTSQVP